MVQIDDAGSGSLIGGTCIGIYLDKKKIFKFDFIPLKFYTPENFKKKMYQQQVITVIKKIFRELSINDDELIEVCPSYIFDALREHFVIKKYNWKNKKIDGILQQKVEQAFADYAISLGLPKDYITYTKYPFHFHKLLRWVYADYDNRKNLCKSGWKSWQKYGYLPVESSTGYLNNKSWYYCLKCGKKIMKKSKIKILKFVSNKENILYIHDNC